MQEPLARQVLETIRKYRMMGPGDRVGVGVSGGADSVALLLLLSELREVLGLRLLVLHFNHRLRGADSDADEAFVAELAGQLGLEFVAGREAVAARARAEGWNLEDAARRLRYDFFDRIVREGRADRVAVGHTADDQAETVLAHILRGTGLTGLAGIYPVRGHMVRPLVELRRAALREYLLARGQLWREDASNLDQTRLRARIRHQLLPVLEREFNPGVVAHLTSLASRAREDEAFWSALLEERMAALVKQTPGGLEIRVADLLAPLPLLSPPEQIAEASGPLTRRLIRRLVEAVKGDRTRLTAQHVEQVLTLAAAPGGGRTTHLPGGVRVERNFDRLLFCRPAVAHPGATGSGTMEARLKAYDYPVDLPQQGTAAVDIPEICSRFCLKLIDWRAAPRETRELPGVLDRDLLSPPFRLRNWRPGDAYRPKGHAHMQKVKRLFREFRIAARERAQWPVFTSGGRVAWVLGLPAAEEYAAGPGTRSALMITVTRHGGGQESP